MDRLDAVSQIISSFVRVNSVSATEYESKTVKYVNNGGRVTTEVTVDVYNRHAAINTVRIGQHNIIDTMA